MNSRLLVLGLHRVGIAPPDAKIRGLFISPRALRFQLSLVRALGYRFMTLRDAIADQEGLRAVVTFDDGYADNYSNAYPILRSMGIPATLFVITCDVGKRMVVWNEADEDVPADMLDWEQIRALHRAGWEIGSHSHEHVHLELRNEDEQRELIERSCEGIEHEVGERPVSFAYPYGTFTAATKRALKDCGIDLAVTTSPTSVDDLRMDTLELGRTALGGRHLRHHLKNIRKIGNAVGTVQFMKGLGSYSLSSALSFASPSLVFPQTNK